MTTTASPTTTTTTTAPERPTFAQAFQDITPMIAALRERGVELSAEQEQRLRHILIANASAFEGRALIGTDFSGFLMKIVYFCTYCIQNVARADTPFSFDNFGAWLSENYNETGSATEFAMVQQATMRIHRDMLAAGFDRRTAELVSGQSDRGAPEDMGPASAYWVLRQGNNPPSLNPSLNNNPNQRPQMYEVADTSVVGSPPPPPSQRYTPSLTGVQYSA